jgi:hypothetical protein
MMKGDEKAKYPFHLWKYGTGRFSQRVGTVTPNSLKIKGQPKSIAFPKVGTE